MKILLFAHRHFARLLCFCLINLALTFSASAQKATTSSKSKSASRKVFYGQASFYANKFNGRQTASGELFSQNKYTCACNVLPFGTWVKVTNLRNGKSVVVKVNDRIHPKMKRLVDLSRVAAKELDYVGHGLARVKVEVIGKKKPN